MTITEFLLARVRENPDVARSAFLDWMRQVYGAATMDDDPEWVDDMVDSFLSPARPDVTPFFRRFALDDEDLREIAAAAYAAHPDFEPAWRQ